MIFHHIQIIRLLYMDLFQRKKPLEFAKISGLAILWGEFIGSEEWRATVGEELVPYTDKLNVEKYNILLYYYLYFL